MRVARVRRGVGCLGKSADQVSMRVSVCMATYNGEKYVGEQVGSILRQMRATDELIVVDDGSSDATIDKVLSFGDDRIRLLDLQTNVGPVQAFGRAIAHAKGDVIFMADQDDIWLDGRLALLLEAFATTTALVVSTNSTYIDGVGRPIDRDAPALRFCDSSKWLRNIAGIMSGRTGYYGCAMAFRSEMRDLLVPFPLYVESHDLWIALAANLLRRNLHLEVPTLARRIHGGNASIVSRPVGAKIWSRIVFVISLIDIAWRRSVRGK